MLCLTQPTPPDWATHAVEDLNALLIDHAHCEMKAASSALSLAARTRNDNRLVLQLIAIAEEELAHFRRLIEVLHQRSVHYSPPPPDPYVAELRVLVHKTPQRPGAQSDALVDRFLVSALIEARSCERLGLLSEAFAAKGQDELSNLYRDLFASEARHYRTFVAMAATQAAGDEEGVFARLEDLARAEGHLAARLGSRAAIHG